MTPAFELLQVSASDLCLLTRIDFWIICNVTNHANKKNVLKKKNLQIKAFWRFLTQIPVVDSGYLRGRGGQKLIN